MLGGVCAQRRASPVVRAPPPAFVAVAASPQRQHTKPSDTRACPQRPNHSNLCVDVVIPVDRLPPPDAEERAALLQQLTAAPPGEEAWECGGISNFAIAASRLGLRTGAVGHLGSDVYGDYMERILKVGAACWVCDERWVGPLQLPAA